jgi:hypothetical protein
MSFSPPGGPSLDCERSPTLPAPNTSSIVFAIGEPVARADIPHLCEALRTLVADSGAEIVTCDVRALRPDAVTVEALARLQLTAVRLGSKVRLEHVSPELCELIDFMGLRAPMSSGSTRTLTT